MGFFSWLFKRKQKQIKVGLALGSGGAKGFAHLGVLKAFEENGISFDVIAGTSIGSVVGAFYSAGYSATDMAELIKRLLLPEFKNVFMAKTSIYDIIDREIDGRNIEELAKPFMAVATKLDTGEEHVFDRGSVAEALTASSSIPPYFKPFIIGGERYVDGAFVNAIPADLARRMGADYVVGVDLHTEESKMGILNKIFPTYKSNVENPREKGYANCDVMLHPDLNQFNSLSVLQADAMYDIGYHHALSFIPKIKEDLEKLRLKKVK